MKHNWYFFGELWKMSRGFIHLSLYHFSHHSKMFFSVQNDFSIERREKLAFISFKMPNDFSIKYSGINFQTGKSFGFIVIINFSCIILGVEFFQKKCLGAVVINDWKIIFEIPIVLQITISPSNVRFLIFHFFNTYWISVATL